MYLLDEHLFEATFKFIGIPGDNYSIELQFNTMLVTIKTHLQDVIFDFFYKIAVNVIKEQIRIQLQYASNGDEVYFLDDHIDEFLQSLGQNDFGGICYGVGCVFIKNGVEILYNEDCNDTTEMVLRDLPYLNRDEDDFHV